jgi:hypothetical protein
MRVPRILYAMLVCSSLDTVAASAATLEDSHLGAGPVTPADSGSEAGPDDARPSSMRPTAHSRAATAADTGNKAERADDRQSPRAGSGKSVGSTGDNSSAPASRGSVPAAPQRGIGQLARPNADRLRSLLNAQARGRPARQPSRGSVGQGRGAGGPNRVANDGPRAVPGQRGHGQVSPLASRPTAVASGPAAVASGAATAASGPAVVASGLGPATSNSGVRAVTGPSAITRAMGRGTAIGGPRTAAAGLVGGPATGRTAHSAMVDGTQFHHGR